MQRGDAAVVRSWYSVPDLVLSRCLGIAITGGHRQIVEILLDAGASLSKVLTLMTLFEWGF